MKYSLLMILLFINSLNQPANAQGPSAISTQEIWHNLVTLEKEAISDKRPYGGRAFVHETKDAEGGGERLKAVAEREQSIRRYYSFKTNAILKQIEDACYTQSIEGDQAQLAINTINNILSGKWQVGYFSGGWHIEVLAFFAPLRNTDYSDYILLSNPILLPAKCSSLVSP